MSVPGSDAFRIVPLTFICRRAISACMNKRALVSVWVVVVCGVAALAAGGLKHPPQPVPAPGDVVSSPEARDSFPYGPHASAEETLWAWSVEARAMATADASRASYFSGKADAYARASEIVAAMR